MSRAPRRRRLLPLVLAVALAVLALPALASAAEARTLRQGTTGADVRALNVRLAALGYLPAGAAGSSFTDATRHAVVAAQKWHGLARDGVVGPGTSAALARNVRPAPLTTGTGRRIEVSLSRQLALLIDGSRVTRTIAVSTGAPGYRTPAGSFKVFRKEVQSWSHPYKVWLPYASYFNNGIAFHGYASVPAQPASHGCVRVPTAFMQELYGFAAMGTRVRVF
jgi:hypothetical protein